MDHTDTSREQTLVTGGRFGPAPPVTSDSNSRFRSETVAIFSFTDVDAQPVREYIHEILTTGGDYQKYLISRLLLLHAENFVVAPALFDSWSLEKRDAIRDFSFSTIRYGSVEQSEHLYLF